MPRPESSEVLGVRHHAGCRVTSALRMRYEGIPGGSQGLLKMCQRASVRCYLGCKGRRQRNCIYDPVTKKKICP